MIAMEKAISERLGYLQRYKVMLMVDTFEPSSCYLCFEVSLILLVPRLLDKLFMTVGKFVIYICCNHVNNVNTDNNTDNNNGTSNVISNHNNKIVYGYIFHCIAVCERSCFHCQHL